jgi:hypothetical protein
LLLNINNCLRFSVVSGKLEIKDVANILDPSQKSKSKQSQDTDQLCLDFEKKHQCHETFQDDRYFHVVKDYAYDFL